MNYKILSGIMLLLTHCLSYNSASRTDLTNSIIYVSNHYILANNQSSTTIYVQLKSSQNNPIVGTSIEVKANDCTYDKPGYTDAYGLAQLTLQCKTAGDKKLAISVIKNQFDFLLEVQPVIHVVERIEPDVLKAGLPTPTQLFLHDKRKLFDPDYSGLIAFRSTDQLATLPGPLHVSADALGYLIVEQGIIWRTPGVQTLWVEDMGSNQVLYEKSFNIQFGDATSFDLFIEQPSTIRVNQPFPLMIRAQDIVGNTVENYQEIVRLYTNDKQASIPFDVRFQAHHKGVLIVSDVILRSSGPQFLFARNAKGDVVGQVNISFVHPGEASTIHLSAFNHPSALQPWSFDIGIEDAFGNPVHEFSGWITLASSDPNATSYAPFVFSPEPNSHRQQRVMSFVTSGNQWISATLQNNQQIIDNDLLVIQVLPGHLRHFINNSVTDVAVAGTPITISLMPYDDAGNPIETYQGTISLTTTDPHALLPSSRYYIGSSEDIWSFEVIFQQAGLQYLTLEDQISRMSTTIAIQVHPNDVVGLAFIHTPTQVIAGTINDCTLIAVDSFGNPIYDFQGNVLIQCSDPPCQGSGTFSFQQDGNGWMHVASIFGFETAGFNQLQAQVLGQPHLQKAIHHVDTIPSQPVQLAFSVQPTDWQSCVPIGPIEVTVLDLFGNRIPIDNVPIHINLHSKLGLKEIYLKGRTLESTAQGTATFDHIIFEHTNERIQFAATSDGLQTAVSHPFEVLRVRPTVTIDGYRAHDKGLAIDYTIASHCPVQLNFSFDQSIYKAHMSADSSMALPRHPIPSGVYHETFVWDVSKDLPNTHRTVPFAIRATYDGLSHQAVDNIPVNTLPQYQWETISPQTTHCLERADINQDGIEDIVGCDEHQVYALYQNHAGQFQYQFLFTAHATQQIDQIKAMDINRDERLDLLLIDTLGALLHPYYATGPNTYAAATPIPISSDIVNVVVHDINIDGQEDILWVSDSNNAVLHTMLAATTGSFHPATTLPLSGIVRQIDVGYFNNDPLPDLIWLGDNHINIRLANASGYEAPITLIFPQPTHRFAVGLIDRNKYTDIVAIGQQEMYLYINASPFPIQTPLSTYAIANGISSATLFDINQDKKTDIVLLQNGIEQGIITWLQSSSRTFSANDSFKIASIDPKKITFISNLSSKQQDIILQRVDGGVERGLSRIIPSSKEVQLDKFYSMETRAANSIIPADIDEDGFMDMIYSTSNEIVFAKGTGLVNAPFLPASYRYDIDAISSFVVQDINGDNHLDLVVASGMVNYLLLFYGDGRGHFIVEQTDSFGEYILDVDVADINQDGHLDILALDVFSGHMHFFFNDSTGVYRQPTYLMPTQPGTTAFAINDYNGDSLMDIAYLNPLYNQLMVAQQNFPFSFQVIKSQDIAYYDITSADLDQDSYMDLVLAGANGAIYASYGDGSGIFPQAIHIGGRALHPTLADLDHNGTPDILGSQVIINQGANRQFTNTNLVHDHIYVAMAMTAADTNNDNILDIISPHGSSPSMFIKHRRSRDELNLAAQERNRFLMNNGSSLHCQRPAHPTLRDKIVDIDNNGMDDFTCNSLTYNGMNPEDPNNYQPVIYINFRDNASSIGELRLTSSFLSRQDGFAVNDLDQDGIQDFMMYDMQASMISLWLSNGDFHWQELATQSIPPFAVLELEDINHDKKVDMIIGTPTGIQVAFGQSMGNFGPWLSLASDLPSPVQRIQFADFNHDRNRDLLFLSGNQLSVLYLTPGGTPSLVHQRVIITNNASVVFDTIDMNADGSLDVVFSQSNQNNLHIALNNQQSNFQLPTPLLTDDYRIRSIGILDADADGSQDIVTVLRMANEQTRSNQIFIITENNMSILPSINHYRQPFKENPDNFIFSWSDLSDNGIDELIFNNYWYINAYPLGIRF